MPNEVLYRFETADLVRLLALQPAYIVVRTGIEPAELNGRAVGVVTIFAEAFAAGRLLVEKVAGCPIPPCKEG